MKVGVTQIYINYLGEVYGIPDHTNHSHTSHMRRRAPVANHQHTITETEKNNSNMR